MMLKLLVLFLLVLSAAGLQDIIKNNSQSKTGAPLSYRTPETQRSLLPSALRRRRRSSPSTFTFEDSSALKWVPWTGSMPDGAFIYSNVYSKRVDYVCKYKCEAGYYNEGMGNYCYYPYNVEERKSSTFEILVNKDGFEIMEWKEGSYATVPQNSVRTCTSQKMYVGKNKYGLGKVHLSHGSFYLPWKGSEYYYKTYEVLTYSHNVQREHISNVKYDTANVKILALPPETMRTTRVTNNGCNPAKKTTTLSKTNRLEKRWDIGSSIGFGVTKSFSGGIPAVGSASVSISAQVSFQFSGGHTKSEESSNSISVEILVPPNHYCKAHMVGLKYTASIPFTAQLSRIYSSGESTETTVSGLYDSIDVGEVQAVIDRCEPIKNARPCATHTT